MIRNQSNKLWRTTAKAIVATFLISSVPALGQECARPSDTNKSAYLKLLKSQLLEKGQFETTDKWEARATELLSKLGNAVSISTRAKVTPQQFDADRGILKLDLVDQFFIFRGVNDGSQDYHGALLAPDEKTSRTLVGQNSYGAKRTIVEVSHKTFGMGIPSSTLNRVIEIPLSPDVARTNISHMTITISGLITSPYVASGTFRQFPTFNYPIGNSYDDRVLTVNPICGAVLGRKAEILAVIEFAR